MALQTYRVQTGSRQTSYFISDEIANLLRERMHVIRLIRNQIRISDLRERLHQQVKPKRVKKPTIPIQVVEQPRQITEDCPICIGHHVVIRFAKHVFLSA